MTTPAIESLYPAPLTPEPRTPKRRFSVNYSRFMDIEKRPASRTAISVAVLRAMHELYDDSPKILSDPIIPLFFNIEVLQKAKANLEWYRDPLTTALRSHVVLRSRYAEDSLHEAGDFWSEPIHYSWGWL